MSYRFTTDWFSRNIAHWEKWLAHLNGQPNICGVEIGSYEGRSAVWLLENIFTDPTSELTCVDSGDAGTHDTFRENTRAFRNLLFEPMQSRHWFADRSRHDLERYHLGYIDGDHSAAAVLSDAVSIFPLLRPGAVLIFDDYEWNPPGRPEIIGTLQHPKQGIDAFLTVFAVQLEVIHQGYQVCVRKR
jgi:predicted O-methyltransferase YrrM